MHIGDISHSPSPQKSASSPASAPPNPSHGGPSDDDVSELKRKQSPTALRHLHQHAHIAFVAIGPTRWALNTDAKLEFQQVRIFAGLSRLKQGCSVEIFDHRLLTSRHS
jgi:hypothetical protein